MFHTALGKHPPKTGLEFKVGLLPRSTDKNNATNEGNTFYKYSENHILNVRRSDVFLFLLVFTEITCFMFLFFMKNLRFYEQHFLYVFIIYQVFTMSALFPTFSQ